MSEAIWVAIINTLGKIASAFIKHLKPKTHEGEQRKENDTIYST